MEYNNIFQFDVRPRGKELLWFSSEIEEHNYSYERFCYSQSIPSFCVGDKIYFRINLFSILGKVEVSTFKFLPFEYNHDIQINMYEKRQHKNEMMFDKYRNCEIEHIVHLWKDIFKLFNKHNNTKVKGKDRNIRRQKVFESFKETFTKHFEIQKVLYDISKYFYIKIIMKAKRKGILPKNQFINSEIEIVHYNDKICNECQSMYILNTNSYKERYQIREGNIIIFYITEI
jgi:hypothetical protein